MSTTDRTVARDGILNTRQVAELLETDRQWVYDHLHDLGAFRIGEGHRARLGFYEDVVMRAGTRLAFDGVI